MSIFEIVPLLMLIFGFAGKLPAPYKWRSLVLLLLVFSQYLTANLPGAGAWHPVIAIGLFWLAVDTARGVLPSYRREQKGNTNMRSLAVLVMALIGGFAGGVVLNAVIAVTSHMVFGGTRTG